MFRSKNQRIIHVNRIFWILKENEDEETNSCKDQQKDESKNYT